MSDPYWDLTNNVLYALCKKNPKHKYYPDILAKVLIIGRSYAAAIERRKLKYKKPNEDYYLDRVAKMICSSDIDKWFDELKKYKTINKNSITTILDVHLEVTQLFYDISGLEKRSLASKYLHFHFPNLYFIYDSRSLKAISILNEYTGRVQKSAYVADNEYRKLFEKCAVLKEYINEEYNVNMNPRQIDNLLLTIFSNSNN